MKVAKISTREERAEIFDVDVGQPINNKWELCFVCGPSTNKDQGTPPTTSLRNYGPHHSKILNTRQYYVSMDCTTISDRGSLHLSDERASGRG